MDLLQIKAYSICKLRINIFIFNTVKFWKQTDRGNYQLISF